MQELVSFYKDQIKKNTALLAGVKKQLFSSSMLRLGIFLTAALGIYLFYDNTKIVAGIIIFTIALFLYLVSRHSGLQYKKAKLRSLIKINETELEVLGRNFHHLPNGNEFKNPEHCFSQDIDLFGRGSFYQYANRTALRQGSEVFSSLLLENAIENIPLKQEAIKELGQMPEWRQNFSAIATLVKTEVSYTIIVNWLNAYKGFVPKYMQVLPMLFSFVSVLNFGLYFMDILNGWGVVLWLFVGLGITGTYLKRINKLSAHTSKVQSTFQQYYRLILELENTNFKSPWLKQQQSIVINDVAKTSKKLSEFSKILNALDQRNNMLFGIVGNGFLLWDLQQCVKIEKWIQKWGNKVADWFEVIAFFDAYNSLGNFAFNHPQFTYPVLVDGPKILKSERAGHPLLNPEKSILNDFEIGKEQFLIVTGANMAGKSTFLRTVSLHIVMANTGLPVCAFRTEYVPIKLITSMRTSDSLTDDESYFFSELKRLKFIVDEIQDDRYFIVLDEILKGTNSTDKAKGSRKFVERLVGSNSTGIIATHDLSLCDVAQEMPQVENFYFDAEIINNELHFDYKFKKGICQNMNASFLLKKMEIVE
ncbi:MutS-related protein [Maribacter sp. 2304DJ31-5]|uniref:MutS-related protein n=1 Tax=Maribacter sp. 2304DJ31-5 TaxID=3386273 RepID=UPI0039BD473B